MMDLLLPPEVLHLVFCHLSPGYLKPALLACRTWRDVGQAPSHWKNVNLRATKENLGLIPEVLSTRRMLAIREVTLDKVEEVEEVEEVLLAISRHRGMTRLNLTGTDLSLVDSCLLAGVVHRMDRLDVRAAKLTTQQIQAILMALGRETKLKTIVFSEIDLTAVDPDILAWAVNRLESVAFVHKSAKLSYAQSQAIYTAVADEDTKLRTLAVPANSVSPAVFALALNKLEILSVTLPGPIAEMVLTQSLVQTKLTRAIITISTQTKLEIDENLVRAARKVIPHLDISKEECPNNHPKGLQT